MNTPTSNPEDDQASEAESKIAEAAGSTVQIAQAVDLAEKALANCGGRSGNGYGIYSDPSRILQSLASAANAIEQAIEIHRATKWPNRADYEQLEN